MLTAAGCVQLNEAVNSQDLECVEVPEDICARLADDIVRVWDSEATEGPIVLVQVRPVACRDIGRQDPAMVRCWVVEGSTAGELDGSGGAGIGWEYFQNMDGRIFNVNGEAIRN